MSKEPISAITNPHALPDSPFPMPQVGETATCATYLSRVGKWFEHYYLQTFRTFTRAGVGKCVHPGYCHMEACIWLLSKGIAYVPKEKRFEFFAPLKFVLDAISRTWTDATAPALGALGHVNELACAYSFDTTAKYSSAFIESKHEKIENETKGLKADLRKLSETLLHTATENTTALGDMMAMLNQIKTGVDTTADGVRFLVDKKHDRIAKGKAAQAKAIDTNAVEKADAAARMKDAIARVAKDKDVKAGKHGAVLTACRRICKRFAPLSTRKDEFGKCPDGYASLDDWQGKPIQPETLARHFRDWRKARPPKKLRH